MVGDSRFNIKGQAGNFIVSAKSKESIYKAVNEIQYLLKIRPGAGKKHNVYALDNAIKQNTIIIQIISFILMAIGSISLVVGGIGVMNIMLVSVSERTREIGIKMALGATKHRILAEFVMESITITFFAGIIGIVISNFLSGFIVSFTPKSFMLKAMIDIKAVLLAFGVSTGTGLFFGIFPAFKASKLSPVEALRYE